MSLRNAILDEFLRVAINQKQALTAFDDASPLFSFGLDSLAFFTFVERMVDKFGVDLFDLSEEAELPMTVGALICFYERRVGCRSDNDRGRQKRAA